MTTEQIKFKFNQFDHKSKLVSFKELASGHINDTFLIETEEEPFFILQRINHDVFKDVPGLISNKVSVSKHLQDKLSHLPEKELKRRVLTFIPTKSGDYYYKDEDGNFWNVMVFIKDSVTYEIVTDKEVAYEGGKLSGDFLNLTSDFDASTLTEVIPKFHNMSFRYAQFKSAIQSAPKERLFKASEYIDKALDLEDEMLVLQKLKDSGEIKTRVTHNDTKISNTLFDTNNKGLCVIDTDTVMPGIVHYDFGDAIRTICNTAAEDETNLDLVNFNVEFYNAYKQGFLEEVESALSDKEIETLPLAAKSMIFIMALRFLTDFLNNDLYYKTKYPEHNLDRAKNQFKLLDSFIMQVENKYYKVN